MCMCDCVYMYRVVTYLYSKIVENTVTQVGTRSWKKIQWNVIRIFFKKYWLLILEEKWIWLEEVQERGTFYRDSEGDI